MELVLKVTVEEGQKILDSLVKQPYEEVAELINKIQSQANSQMNSAED